MSRRKVGDAILIAAVVSLMLLATTSFYISQTLIQTWRMEGRDYWDPIYHPVSMDLNASVPLQNMTIASDHLRIAHFNITGSPISILIVASDSASVLNVSGVSGTLVGGASHDGGSYYNITVDSSGGGATVEFIYVIYYWVHEDYPVSTLILTPQSVEVMMLGVLFLSIAAILLLVRLYFHLIRNRHIVKQNPPWMRARQSFGNRSTC